MHGFISRGGWTSHENYDRAKAMLEEFREEGLKLMSGEELAEFEKIEIGQFFGYDVRFVWSGNETQESFMCISGEGSRPGVLGCRLRSFGRVRRSTTPVLYDLAGFSNEASKKTGSHK